MAAPETEIASPKRGTLSIIIPVHNEAWALPELLPHINQAAGMMSGVDVECIIVDDGSTDGTYRFLDSARKAFTFLKPVRLHKRAGKSAAMKAGIEAATGNIIATLDGDLQNDPLDLPSMLRILEASSLDLLNGWRTTRRDNWFKRTESACYNRIVNRLFHMHLHDHNCGIKIFRRSALEGVRLRGEWHHFLTVLSHRAGHRVGELHVSHRQRKYGRSRYGLDRYFSFAADLIRTYRGTPVRNQP